MQIMHHKPPKYKLNASISERFRPFREMKRRGVGEEVKVRQRDWTRAFLHAPTDFAIERWTPFFAVKTSVRSGNEEEEEESDRGDDRPSLHRGVEISE
jgi:hypothetical protein